MPYYMLTGEALNAIDVQLPSSHVVMAPTGTDALYPLAQMFDGKPYLATKWIGAGADPRVTVDLNQIPGDGEGPGSAPATSYSGVWTADVGTIAVEGTIKNSGASSIKLTGVGAQCHVDILVRAGQKRKAEWALYGNTVATNFQVTNLHTGKNLFPDGSWGALGTLLDSQVAASWKTGSIQYQVESLAACGSSPLVWLRFTFISQGATPAYIDDILDYPAVDFAGCFGTQNWDPVLAPQLRSSTDNFSGSDVLQGAMTFAKPVVSVRLAAPVYNRWWRLKLLGTPRVAPGLGEFVLGQAQLLQRAPQLGPKVSWIEAGQIRRGAISGATRARNMGPWPTRDVQMSWRFKDQASFRQFRDELFRGSRGGAIPTILMATDATQGLDYPVFGMLSETFAGKRIATTGIEVWDVDVEINEQPFPSL